MAEDQPGVRGDPAKGTRKDAELLAHADMLFRYALRRVRDKSTAEDLVQETLVAAVAQLDAFAGHSAMRTWLVGILKHKILDHFRARARQLARQIEPTSGSRNEPHEAEEPWFTPYGTWRIDPNQGLESLDADPSAAIERAELRDALAECIQRLPKSLHRVFVLRELEELEPDAACEAAGISRESLAVFLYRARQTLRGCLQKKWIDA